MAKTIKAVTAAQLAQVGKMAAEKGVGKDAFQQHGLDDGTLARVLDQIKNDHVLTQLSPLPGGRLHIVRVQVDRSRDWREAINVAGPDTPADSTVCKVGDLYPSAAAKGEEELILLNFPEGGSWEKACDWADQSGLVRTHPRQVFATGEHSPNFHRELGLSLMYVVATTECTFEGGRQACYVRWDGLGRETGLGWLEGFGDASDWFAFRRK